MVVDPQIEKLRGYVEASDFSGYDPYDALNSPLAGVLTAGTKWGRIALTQLLRRSPVNFRPALFIRSGHNPKALALFLTGYCRLARLRPDPATLRTISRLVGLLATLRSRGFVGNCWGYNFPWQSRAFFAPRFTPTSVVSSFVGHALLDAYDATQNVTALELALPIRDFLLHALNRIEAERGFCFSYSPVDHYPVHNANMLAASLLARLGYLANDSEALDAAHGALAYTLDRQRPDGSWPYSERKGSTWIDSFHTGFVLESLGWFGMLDASRSVADARERGTRYYADKMFLPDGTPKYYHDRVYPIDIHSPAEAIVYFSGNGEAWANFTDAILAWTLENLRDPAGYFYFRRAPRSVNRIPYIRWAQAWMFHALTAYALNCAIARPPDAASGIAVS